MEKKLTEEEKKKLNYYHNLITPLGRYYVDDDSNLCLDTNYKSPQEIEKDWQKPENQKKLKKIIKESGEYQKVVDGVSGVEYKVPTKDIITKGLKQQDLDKYPIWED